MRMAIYPGSFDPPTLGHWDIIQRAAKLFDVLYLAVGVNNAKNEPLFSFEERLGMLKTLSSGISNVHVISFEGLVVDLAKRLGAKMIVRGVRGGAHFDEEACQASMNRAMEGIETLFLCADGRYAGISSTLVKEVARGGRRLDLFVPGAIEDDVFKKLSIKTQRTIKK